MRKQTGNVEAEKMSRAARTIRTDGVILYVRSIDFLRQKSRNFWSPWHCNHLLRPVSGGALLWTTRSRSNQTAESNDIVFKLVDLAKSSLAVRLKATFRRVKTPTMIWKERKISNVESIRLSLEKG